MSKNTYNIAIRSCQRLDKKKRFFMNCRILENIALLIIWLTIACLFSYFNWNESFQLTVCNTWLQYRCLLVFFSMTFAALISLSISFIYYGIKSSITKHVVTDYVYANYVIGKKNLSKQLPKVIILYTTSDDFIEHCCHTALKQDYKNVELFILDDSKDKKYQDQIDKFSHKYHVNVVRRKNKHGWKGGNVSDFLNSYKIPYDYFVLLDSDTSLRKDFISKNIPLFYANIQGLGFVQADITVYNSSNFFSQLGAAKVICTQSTNWATNYLNVGFNNWQDYGLIVKREVWQTIKNLKNHGLPDFVNCDTTWQYHSYIAGWNAITSSLSPVSEQEPTDIINYWTREKRWWFAQIDFWRVNKFTTLKNRRCGINNFFYFLDSINFFKIYMMSIWSVFFSISIPIFFVLGFHNIHLYWISSILVSLLWGVSLLLVVIVDTIKTKSLYFGLKVFLGLLLYAVVCWNLSFMFIFRWVCRGRKQQTFNVTDKHYKKMTFKKWTSFNKWRIISTLFLFVACAFLCMLAYGVFGSIETTPSDLIVTIAYSLFWPIIPLLYFLTISWFSNIKTRSPYYEFYFFHEFNNLRQKYKIKTLPISLRG